MDIKYRADIEKTSGNVLLHVGSATYDIGFNEDFYELDFNYIDHEGSYIRVKGEMTEQKFKSIIFSKDTK